MDASAAPNVRATYNIILENTNPSAGALVGQYKVHALGYCGTATTHAVYMQVSCVTYAAFGETMNYWGFFPADDPDWGRIPVWGFANVVESRCDGINPGERVYGYWPISTHAVLQPERVNSSGFVDALRASSNNKVRTTN